MATAHQLAVITSSCFKAPVNPKTGMPYMENERKQDRSMNQWVGRDADFNDEVIDASRSQLSKSVNFDTTNMTNTMMETMNKVGADLSHLSDDDFYSRLTQLKSEHKKTLELCERLYHEKLHDKDQRTGISAVSAGASSGATPPRVSVNADYELATTTQPVNEQGELFNQSREYLRSSMTRSRRDLVRDMSAMKPPTGRPHSSSGTPLRSGSMQQRVYTSPNPFRDSWRSVSVASSDTELSGDEKYTSEDKEKSIRQQKAISETKEHAMSQIDEMWKDFIIDKYTPRLSRPRSASLSRISSSTRQENKGSDWKNKITVPKPFEMTLRDVNKIKKKTKAMEEIERSRVERENQEEEECQKKFKAKPVPAHVYMPLYDEIMESQEEKRQQTRKTCSDQSMIKPFKFQIREEEKKKLSKTQSVPSDILENNKKPPVKFTANPFPDHLFDNTVEEKLKEEEEYRKIRIQMRAEELLHSSSLPGTMESRRKDYIHNMSRKSQSMERAKKAGIAFEHSFTPRINETVPDFEELHSCFHQQLSQAKQQKMGTVCKPFRLQSSKSPSTRHKIYEDILKDEQTLKENRWPFQSRRSDLYRSLERTGSLSTSMDSLPTKMTTSAELRKSANRRRIDNQISQELNEIEAEKMRIRKEKQLKKMIAERAAANDRTPSLRSSSRQKLREYRDAERHRSKEYRQQLQEIQDRVQQRPLLFEQMSQENAKHKADRRYKETLQRAGVDEDFIQRKGSRTEDSRTEDHEESDHVSSYRQHSQSQSGTRNYTDDFDDGESDGDKTVGSELEEDLTEEEA